MEIKRVEYSERFCCEEKRSRDIGARLTGRRCEIKGEFIVSGFCFVCFKFFF